MLRVIWSSVLQLIGQDNIMEIEEIQSELFKAIDRPNVWQTIQHLMLKLEKENSEKVLDALLGIFFDINNSCFEAQAATGGLLWMLKPKYKRNLREDIQSGACHPFRENNPLR